METLVALIQHYGLAFVFVNVLMLQAGLPVPGVSDAHHHRRARHPRRRLVAGAGRRRGGRLPDRRRRLVHGRPQVRQRRAEDDLPHLAVAGFVRAADRVDLRALGRALAGGRQVHPGLRIGGDVDGRRRAPAACGSLSSSTRSAPRLWSGVAIGLGYAFSGAINEVLAVFETLGKIGLWIIAGAFVLYIAAKWWQRELFIWQLRMDRVTVDELHELMQGNRVGKVIDVRSPMSQAMTGRIPGAITVDPNKLRVDLLAIEPESEVIVYCACPNEYTAAKLAKALVQHGFKRVRPLLGGIDAWIAARSQGRDRRSRRVLK